MTLLAKAVSRSVILRGGGRETRVASCCTHCTLCAAHLTLHTTEHFVTVTKVHNRGLKGHKVLQERAVKSRRSAGNLDTKPCIGDSPQRSPVARSCCPESF